MVDLNPFYAPSVTVTVTGLASLANAQSATSNSVSNLDYVDYVLTVTVATTASALAGGTVEVYCQGSLNNISYDDTANDKWVGTIYLPVTGAQTRVRTMTLAASFGGTLPPFFKIRMKNSTGADLAATGSSLIYRAVTMQMT